MSKSKRNNISEGYGKLLEQWEAPNDSGEPIGCIATTFTFAPAFFEEECLGRFLKLDTDSVEDGSLYLVEREEKLAQVVCAAVLVDQHNCQGARSLRWDLHPARVSGGILHAKISMLCWSNQVRLIIGSANLTEDGYRRNQEVFGVLDYYEGTEAPRQVLADVVAYLRNVMDASQVDTGNKAIDRWHLFLDQIGQKAGSWGQTEDEHGRMPLRVFAILTKPGEAHVFKQLNDLWPSGSPPHSAMVLSPFFDSPEADNKPAGGLWEIMRKRGNATVNYCLEMEEVQGEERLLVRAPDLRFAKPYRESTRVIIRRLKTDLDRPLHAKELWFEDDRFVLLMIGSSNFTSAGLGLGKTINFEANLAYILDMKRKKGGYKDLIKRFPESVIVKQPIKFEHADNGEDKPTETVLLSPGFKSAIYRLKEGKTGQVVLELGHGLPAQWQLLDEDEKPWQDVAAWEAAGKPSTWEVLWLSVAPSGIWVTWPGSQGKAWWPINVESSTDLPPPEELKDLSLEILINLLTSARPLHEVLRRYLRKHRKGEIDLDVRFKDTDPHKRVDTSAFLMQRTRRFSWALNSLGKRLERPVPTEECLNWRIHGPVGVMALAKALDQDAKSNEERSFLMAELALELTRVRPEEKIGYLPARGVREALLAVAHDLCKRGCLQVSSDHKCLQMYLRGVFDHIDGKMVGG